MRSEAREQTRSALFGWIIIQSDMKISWIADQLSPETDALISPDWLCSYKLSIDKSRVWVQSDVDVDLTGPVHTVTLKFICSLVDMVTTGVNPPGLMSQATSWWSEVFLSTSVSCECKCVSDCKLLVFTQHAKPENSVWAPSDLSSLYMLIIMPLFLSLSCFYQTIFFSLWSQSSSVHVTAFVFPLFISELRS